jgi:hypothetical protein
MGSFSDCRYLLFAARFPDFCGLQPGDAALPRQTATGAAQAAPLRIAQLPPDLPLFMARSSLECLPHAGQVDDTPDDSCTSAAGVARLLHPSGGVK